MSTTEKQPPTENPGDPPGSSTGGKRPKVRKELEVVSIPSDEEMIAEEMEELFEEDKVTHQHGSSEPEAD